MKRLLITIIVLLILALALVGSAALVENRIWHEGMLLIGGMLGGCTLALFALFRVCKINPNIITEIEKLDIPK